VSGLPSIVPIPRGVARGIDTSPFRPPKPRPPERRGRGRKGKDSGQARSPDARALLGMVALEPIPCGTDSGGELAKEPRRRRGRSQPRQRHAVQQARDAQRRPSGGRSLLLRCGRGGRDERAGPHEHAQGVQRRSHRQPRARTVPVSDSSSSWRDRGRPRRSLTWRAPDGDSVPGFGEVRPHARAKTCQSRPRRSRTFTVGTAGALLGARSPPRRPVTSQESPPRARRRDAGRAPRLHRRPPAAQASAAVGDPNF